MKGKKAEADKKWAEKCNMTVEEWNKLTPEERTAKRKECAKAAKAAKKKAAK